MRGPSQSGHFVSATFGLQHQVPENLNGLTRIELLYRSQEEDTYGA